MDKLKIWIDVDNAPHVPLFLPIIDKLEKMGHEVIITARGLNETFALLRLAGIKYHKIGRHYGKNKINKLFGFFIRAFQLYLFGKGTGISIGVCHGAKSFPIAAGFLKIPVIYMFDYEHGKMLTAFGVTKYMVPAYITDEDLKIRPVVDKAKLSRFPALKEQIYAHNFIPNPDIIQTLNLDTHKTLALIRPPASEAHYHNPEGDVLFIRVLEFLATKDTVHVILLPRTTEQRDIALEIFSHRKNGIIIPQHVTNGLNLIWHSDLVISGGGTMIREAVALNVPAYSIFKGNLGAVDRYLSEKGLLHLIKSPKDIQYIVLKKKIKKELPEENSKLLDYIVKEILKEADFG